MSRPDELPPMQITPEARIGNLERSRAQEFQMRVVAERRLAMAHVLLTDALNVLRAYEHGSLSLETAIDAFLKEGNAPPGALKDSP